jgi:4-hydroxy-tetrahydrodipicolinate synthase
MIGDGNMMRDNNYKMALQTWNQLARIIPLLFKEPNPAPLKYILHKQKLIQSGELRLPLVEISANLKMEIDNAMGFVPQAMSAGKVMSMN